MFISTYPSLLILLIYFSMLFTFSISGLMNIDAQKSSTKYSKTKFNI